MRLFLLTGLCCAAFATSAQASEKAPVYGPSATQDAPSAAAEREQQAENSRYRLTPLQQYKAPAESGCQLRLVPAKVKFSCQLSSRHQ